MMTRRLGVMSVLGAAVALGSLTALPAQSDQIADSGKQVVSKWSSSIVTVQITVKTSVSYGGEQGQKREDKNESTGIIIDPSGLLVMPLSTASPDDIMNAMGGDEKVSSEVTDLKILLPDGRQIPSRIVLRDKDLDLAFIRPIQKPAQPLPALDLSQSSKPGVLDQIIMISRLGMVASRTISASVNRIDAVVEKPRTFYVVGRVDSPGATAFSLDGTPVGMVVLRMLKGTGSFSGMPMILPMSDIADAAKQAPTTVPAPPAPTPSAPPTSPSPAKTAPAK